jgi:type II secretory pathway component PulM
MKRTLTTRERWLLVALPALAILVAYLYGFYRPQQKALTDARQALAACVSQQVPPTQFALQRQTLRELEDRLDILKRQVPDPAAAKEAAASAVASPCGEAEAMARITGIFGRRGVVVVSCTRLAESDSGIAMPAGLGDMLTKLAGPGVGLPGGVWRVRTVGTFADVQKSLEVMAGESALVVPLGIAMEPSEDGQTHPWSLWVWM